MEEKEGKKKGNFWLTLATFIVDKRKAIMILFVIAIVYCVLSIDKVQVNQDITSYLPDTSETARGLDIMAEEFVTNGSARVMVANVTYEEAEDLVSRIEDVEGVKSVTFDDSKDHYTGTNALYDVMVEGEDEDPVSIAAMDGIEEELSEYDVYISTTIGSVAASQEMLDREMGQILVFAIIIIIAVLLISTKAFLEIPVLLITFGVAAILNMGTNYWFGEISFVTNSIAVVLQLALAIDYAIILCDRFMEEHETMDAESAVKVALSKAIPEIGASSLTTVSGMVALMTMQFRLGFDMGIVLVKAILFSLISVFLLMPGVLLIFAKGIDKTHHKSFVPKIGFLSKGADKTKYIIPPIFLVLVVAAFFVSSNSTYLFDTNSVESAKKSDSKIATEKVESVFGKSNQLVVMVPSGDYEKEAAVLEELGALPYVKSALGLANQEISDEYTLTEKITPRQFAEFTDLDVEVVQLLYSAYAYNQEQYGPMVTGIDDYEVPIIDMFLFLYDQYQEGYVTLDDDMDEMLNTLYDTLHDAQLMLQGENYSRFVLSLDKPTEGQEVYDAMDEIRAVAEKYYGEGTAVLAGTATSSRDLEETFSTDNIIISVLTALFVLIVLFFTFQSAGLPVLLVLAIQGSIWINFSIPALQDQGIYFIGYLIVSAIQMGATIDYAIVISSRYVQLKYEEPLKDAIADTLDQAFPTIFTSGTIMTCAGFLIGNVSTDATVSSLGTALGRGTLISIIVVIFVLPQILLLGDYIIEKTKLTMKLNRKPKEMSGHVFVNGHVKGQIHGEVDADIQGYIQGDMEIAFANVIPGREPEIRQLDGDEDPSGTNGQSGDDGNGASGDNSGESGDGGNGASGDSRSGESGDGGNGRSGEEVSSFGSTEKGGAES